MKKLSEKEISDLMIVAYKNPFGTSYDPRQLLEICSKKILSKNPNNKLAMEMELAWLNPFDKKYNHRELLKKGSKELLEA